MGWSGARTEWLPAIPEDETPWLSPDNKPLSDTHGNSGSTYSDPVRRDAVMKAFKVCQYKLFLLSIANVSKQ